jgi:hypothetical protein
VLKAQVFLTDLDHFHGFDTVWKRYFKVPPPRTTIGCTDCWSKDTLVEIDLIGYVPSKGLKHESSSRVCPVHSRTTARVSRSAAAYSRPARSPAITGPGSAGGTQTRGLSVLRL